MAKPVSQNSHSIKHRIRELRKKKSLTQKELGEKIGSDGRTISLYERGKFKPAADVIVALAEVLEISTDLLLKARPYEKEMSFEDEELLYLFWEMDKLPVKERETVKKFLKLFTSYRNSPKSGKNGYQKRNK